MKSSDKRSITIILATGVLIAAAILLWPRPRATEAGPVPKRDEQIELSVEQIAAAGITTGHATEASITQSVQLPGEVRFNDDRTAHIVPSRTTTNASTAQPPTSSQRRPVTAPLRSPRRVLS